jgi:DNA-binding PadR family transcriptional regulator
MFNPTFHDAGRGRRHHDYRHGPDAGPLGFGRGFGARGPRAMIRRGEIRPLILATLAQRPMHGYEVIQELEAQSGGRWRPSAGSVYPTLQQLADERLVTSEEIDGRRVYTLTDEGRAAAEAAPAPGWPDHGRHGRSDIRRLARQVAEAAMQVQRVGSPNAVTATETILLDTRSKLYGLLAGDGIAQPADEGSPDEGPSPDDVEA